MILLLLALLKEQVVPVRKDRIDHLLLWIIQISLVVLFVTLPQAVLSEEEHTAATPEFFLACSGGKLAEIKTYLSEHHGWVNARTDNGEACLHLTGIHGHTDVTEYLLVNGADPNIRSTYEHGLRMHPLSWNIYGGHVGNVDLLLIHGADPNLDFDGMGSLKEAVTALDLVMQLIQNEEGDTRFVQLEKMLRGNGAKTMKELLGGTGEESEL